MPALLSNGTQLKLSSDTTTSSYVTIGAIESVSGVQPMRDSLEVSTLESYDSTNLQYKEFLAGAFSGGKPTLSILFQPNNTTHQLLTSAVKAGTLRPGRIHFDQLGTATTNDWVFSALVESVGPQIQVGQVMKASVTLQISGPMTLP